MMKPDAYTKTMLTVIAVSLCLLVVQFVLVPVLRPDEAMAGRLVTATQNQYGTSGTLGNDLIYTTSPGEPWDINLYEVKDRRIYLLGNFNYGWKAADPAFNRVKGQLD